MTKEEFVIRIRIIDDYIISQKIISKYLNNTFFKNSSPSAFSFGGGLFFLAIEQLSELSGIPINLIGWYLTTHQDYSQYAECGLKIDNQTYETFWDYAMINKNVTIK